MPTPITPLPIAAAPTSYAHIDDDWYVVANAADLKTKPLSRRLFGRPVVLFRTQKGVACLEDRCPHRNVPLSAGRVTGHKIECAYHGWKFDAQGECRHIPCLDGPSEARARSALAYHAEERDGYIWVYARAGADPADAAPKRTPFDFPHMSDTRYTKIRTDMTMAGTVHAVAENALDVPHTAFLHGGLFRKPGRRHPIEVVIKRTSSMAEAEYLGEPAPSGLMGKALAPRGGIVTHFDRFLLPSITQVEYRLGEDSHIVVTSALTPIDADNTHLYGMAAFKSPLGKVGGAVAHTLAPLAKIVLGQDKSILELQTEQFNRFGGESLISTDVDVLGPHIYRLMKDAESGARNTKTLEKRLRMFV